MRRREFLLTGAAIASCRRVEAAAPAPIPEPHFPSRLYQFVWRNWELANSGRMAQVVRAKDSDILALGSSMGLPRKPVLSPDQLRRLYITVIRQNWHLLPEDQIVQLLGWTRARLAFTLQEDDFLAAKLGAKPDCGELAFAPPAAREIAGAAEIRKTVEEIVGALIHQPGEERFHFVRALSEPVRSSLREDVRPAPGEIDLSRGWHVAAPKDGVLAPAADRLRDYLRTVMSAGVEGRQPIHLETDPALAPGVFRVETGRGAMRIRGRDSDAVLQGIYWLEDSMEQRGGPFLSAGQVDRRAVWNPRYLYSYFSLYGDPLLDPAIDPLPEFYLERLARTGINGVWIQGLLRTLAPSAQFPEFGESSAARLATLRKLVARARRFGMKIYLYLNEPRALPDDFFRQHPEIRGVASGGLYAMCTSTPEVRDWLRAALAHVTREAPDLGGIFCITMSENHTNCFSHGGAWGVKAPLAKDCPRCSARPSWDVIGELIHTFRDGVRAGSSTAGVIAWDWGWPDELSERLIPALPKDVLFMSVSEWDQPVHRGGVATRVGEYSISVVGPGPRASRNWQRARASGIRTMAKVQFNNTWEISAVPYVPVPPLILEHCENLSRAGISGIMPSWTCGGYPSPNLAAAKAYYFEPRKSPAGILDDIATQRYGKDARGEAVAAWKKFSEAFVEYPYGVAVYKIPTQHGPANLLRLGPTGYRSAMILNPHDDLKGWCGAYPAEVVQRQFAKMAAMWKDGLALFRAALAKTSARKKKFAEIDLAIAETCYHHFQSTANQVEFYMQRDSRDPAARNRMRAIAAREIELAKRQFAVARRHSEIAYEASNHYYYTPLDLVEKILNCRQVIRELES